ncbi:hypothetical protein ACIHIX_39355 [Streptomyces sp. NPDC051913]|uniref:hypothetical protein n=1 Tax=Streptomyces sp. NPDC051913 TaxID=3365676 RepID=UPI0037CE8A55
MFLTIPDADLSEVLTSQTLLLKVWPDAAREVMVLLQLLRSAMPTLADALAIGLIAMAAPTSMSRIELSHRRAALTATGCRTDGSTVEAPHSHLTEITRLEVHDVRAEGRSGLWVQS